MNTVIMNLVSGSVEIDYLFDYRHDNRLLNITSVLDSVLSSHSALNLICI